MDDTFFQVPADKIDRLTDCYTFVPGKGRVMYDRGAESAWSRAPKLVSGGGGLVSTALDYHRFCTMCLNGGELDGARIVGRKTIELMTHEPPARRRGPGEPCRNRCSARRRTPAPASAWASRSTSTSRDR